jgi:hypothetical protein
MSRRVEKAGKRAEAEARRLEAASSVAIAAASRAAEGGGEGDEEWLPRTLKRQDGTRNSVDLGSPELLTRSLGGGQAADAAPQQSSTGGGRAAGQRSNSWQLKTMLGKMIPRVSSKKKKANAQRKVAAAAGEAWVRQRAAIAFEQGEAGVLSDCSTDGGTTEGGTTEDEGHLPPPEEQQVEAALMREMMGRGRNPTSRGKQRKQQGLGRDWTLPPTLKRQGGTRDSVDLGSPELLTRSLPVQTRSLGEHLSPQRMGRNTLGGGAADASNVAAAASSGRKSAEQWRQYYAAQAAQATAAAVAAAAAAVPHWRKASGGGAPPAAHAANFSSRAAPKMTASQEAIVREMMGGKL